MYQPSFVLAMLLAALAPQLASAVNPTEAPFGSWRSPITAQMLVEGNVRFGDTSLDGDSFYWVESRPQEQGRYVIVRRTPDGKIDDVLPAPFSARTLVHEYGGGAILASAGTVYFANYEDQRLWRMVPGQPPQPITVPGKLRFADFVLDIHRKRLISVCEDHTAGGHEPANRIVAIDLADGKITPLVEGADFYSNPRVSPDGRQLCWLSWNHPNLPWDGTVLYVAELDENGALGKPRKIAGGEEESLFQPTWSPDGALYFVSDRTNWWNLYTERAGKVVPVLPLEAEFASAQWVFGITTFGFDDAGRVVARFNRGGKWQLARIEPSSGKLEEIRLPYSNISSIDVGAESAFVVASSPTESETLVEISLADGKVQTIRRSSPLQAHAKVTSIPEAIEFPTDGGKTAHAFYYPPTNADFRGPVGEMPPLLVLIHGGPTSATAAQFRPTTQFWTSRGFGVCDVNYGGSTGFGRDYRNRLRGSWGVVDVADAANAALFLAKEGKADPKKLIIRGGSAGGYTTLACLAFRDTFCCGASYYGISDLIALTRDTHKFEARYNDRLVGPYPQAEALYKERSPINHLDSFNEPIILLQGLEDKIVLPNQAEAILESLKKKGVPVAYVPFAGEQHGFRKAENIVRAQEAELYFYSRILGFDLPVAIEPVEILNLPLKPLKPLK